MSVELTFYTEDKWEDMKSFIKESWDESHPFTKKELYEWQFKGFGNENRNISSILLLDKGKIIGMRGLIPGLYQVPLPDGQMKIINGGSLAMWKVHKDYRGQKLGLMMQKKAEEVLPVITGAGSVPTTSIPFYKKSGFSILDAMIQICYFL